MSFSGSGLVGLSASPALPRKRSNSYHCHWGLGGFAMGGFADRSAIAHLAGGAQALQVTLGLLQRWLGESTTVYHMHKLIPNVRQGLEAAAAAALNSGAPQLVRDWLDTGVCPSKAAFKHVALGMRQSRRETLLAELVAAAPRQAMAIRSGGGQAAAGFLQLYSDESETHVRFAFRLRFATASWPPGVCHRLFGSPLLPTPLRLRSLLRWGAGCLGHARGPMRHGRVGREAPQCRGSHLGRPSPC